jgi:hypothetical protein
MNVKESKNLRSQANSHRARGFPSQDGIRAHSRGKRDAEVNKAAANIFGEAELKASERATIAGYSPITPQTGGQGSHAASVDIDVRGNRRGSKRSLAIACLSARRTNQVPAKHFRPFFGFVLNLWSGPCVV